MTDSDPLRTLIRSTLDFFARFDAQPSVPNAIMNFEEEVGELIEAARAGTDPAHTAEEAADVIVTAIGVCWASGVEMERLIEQVYAVAAKNDAKTYQTHHSLDGKIRRRQ